MLDLPDVSRIFSLHNISIKVKYTLCFLEDCLQRYTRYLTFNFGYKNIMQKNEKLMETFNPVACLTDYFCPFCGQKLFKGNVANFNMVCSNCNKLVRSRDMEQDETEEQS